MMTDNFDYIIIGAGSAGCILANRLTESGEHSVLLLENGGKDNHIFIQMPTALSYPMNMKKFNWWYDSEPEPHVNNRTMHCPRGKVLGGSSSINGMVYVRGHAYDFDQWQAQGAANWSYQDCLPYFKRAETFYQGENDYHGNSGEVTVCNGNDMQNPLYKAFIKAGQDAGYAYTEDYNGHRQEGFGPMHMSVKNGVRASTANAHLKPALKRPNLTVRTHVLVDTLVLEGKTAVGVTYHSQGKTVTVKANKEVIISAGSIGSPSLLQRSGIGAKHVLAEAGVELVHELNGVGENLQDHLEVYFQYQCSQPITLNSKLGLFSKALIGTQWMLNKTGLGATNHFESCGFIRSRAGLKAPNIQYHFLPAAMRYDGHAAFKGHGYQVHVGPNKPHSRGRVWITSKDPSVHPKIQFNYLEHAQDKQDWRDCIRLTREILQQPALEPFRQDEIQPGLDIDSDEAINSWVRDNVESAYHPSCTCKMGADDDDMAVVDNQCRVRGMAQLRVVDSSIFPEITNGNLNAPTIMVAEKAADIILGKPALPKADVAVWTHPDYQHQQR